MNYSTEQLKMIENYAAAYIKPSDIAVIIEVPPPALREDLRKEDHPAAKAYRKGKILSKVRIHTQEMKLAFIGSPLALDNVRKNLMDMEDDE